MPNVSFRMASASRKSGFDVQTNTTRKNHQSAHTEDLLTTPADAAYGREPLAGTPPTCGSLSRRPRLRVSHKTRPVMCRGDQASTGTPGAPVLAAEADVPRSFAPLSLRTTNSTLARLLLPGEGEEADRRRESARSSLGAVAPLTGQLLLCSGRRGSRCCIGDYSSLRGPAWFANRLAFRVRCVGAL
jgi:hypothetical protein